MLVGAGTVLNVAQGREAVEAGAKFIVSPGFSRELIDECAAQGIPALPGCATPSEIMDALDAGLKIVKFFPANVYGGLDAMKALASAFVGVKFMPTGGINAKNLAEYLSAPFIHAVGGTWLCSRTDIAAHNFDRITALCREARKIALGYELGARRRQYRRPGVGAGDQRGMGKNVRICGGGGQFLLLRRNGDRGNEPPVSGRERTHRYCHALHGTGD